MIDALFKLLAFLGVSIKRRNHILQILQITISKLEKIISNFQKSVKLKLKSALIQDVYELSQLQLPKTEMKPIRHLSFLRLWKKNQYKLFLLRVTQLV